MKRFATFLYLAVCILGLSKNLIYLNEKGQTKVYPNVVISDNSRDYVKLDSLNELVKGIVISQSLRQEESIMILPSGTIVTLSHKTLKATVEFGNEFDNALIIRDNVVYLNSELVSLITGKSVFSEPESVILYAQPVKIKSIENSLDYLKVTLNVDVLPDFFTIWWTASGALALTFKPAILDPVLPYDGISITFGRDFVKFSVEKPWGDVEFEIVGNTLIVRSASGLGRTLRTITKADYTLSVYESYVVGRKFTMSYLEMNGNNFNFSVELANGGIAGLEKATAILQKSEGEVMINGGYFDQNQNLPIGLLMREGKILGLPTLGRPAVYFSETGRVYVSRMDIIYLARIGQCFVQLNGVNSPYRGEAVLYTQEYRNSIPKFDDFRYLIIGSDGTVLSTVHTSSLKKGQSVLVLSPSAAQKVGNVVVGDRVELEILNSCGESLSAAVEGGPMIIHDGAPVTDYERDYYSSSLLDVRAPRTLVGIKKGSGKVVFIVIDGYQQNSYGLTFKEMIEFFKDKEFSSLMCLDGGKSSVMSVEGKIVNSPSSGIPSLPVVIIGTRK